MYPAIFLDRDGVIIENRDNYVRNWGDVVIYPQALNALASIHDGPYKVIIVTNQSVVGRGIISMASAERINERLVGEIVQAGGRIDGVYMCPHRPEANCDCRKPKPGLLLRASQELSLDLKRSIMIGDALSDLQAAAAAGIPRYGLVRTGRGRAQSQLAEAAELKPLPLYATLANALSDLL